jgi:hypothetical protein
MVVGGTTKVLAAGQWVDFELSDALQWTKSLGSSRRPPTPRSISLHTLPARQCRFDHREQILRAHDLRVRERRDPAVRPGAAPCPRSGNVWRLSTRRSALDETTAAIHVRFRQDQRELVAAVARHEIGARISPLQDQADLAQRRHRPAAPAVR